MLVRVLGSAAGGGFPQWNCNCENCRLARAGDPRAPARSQSSLAVSADGARWVLLNASPDIRQQIESNPPLHPQKGLRHSPIAAVVLTNADVDHVAGLLSLRERQAFALYGSQRVLDALAENPLFRVLDPALVERRELSLARPIALAGPGGEPLGLELEAFAVPGKIALYLEDESAGPGLGTAKGDTLGLAVGEPGRPKLHYVPGCAGLDRDLARRLAGAALLLFDGTLFRDEEMPSSGTGAKTGRRMGHMAMEGPEGSLAAIGKLDVGLKVFIHINNTNPVLVEGSPERLQVEAAGWKVACDGQEFRL